jgi:hypothetical protein
MNSDKLKPINFLEEQDLPIGHFQRFENKLDKEFHSRKNIPKLSILIAAASILIFITIGTLIINNFRARHSSKLLLAKYSPDLAETEKYYKNTLNNKIKTIREHDNIDLELNSEIKEFQESVKTLSSDLKINPGDERLVNAYLGLYQTQIELLDTIIEQYN